MTYFLTVVFVLISALLILIVLMQRGRGGGLSGAFGMGGGGGAGTAFGVKTGDVFTWVTIVLFVIFLLLAIVLNFKFRGEKETNAIHTSVSPTATQAPAKDANQAPKDFGGTIPTGPATPESPATPATPATSAPAAPATGPAK